MGKLTERSDAATPTAAGTTVSRPRLLLASRGDALTPFLFSALERRFPIAGVIDPELTSVQRYQVAAATFRPSPSAWVERFYKSGHAHRFRSANAVRELHRLGAEFDVVLQVHALFDIAPTRNMLYIDCTHQQSVDQWPAWNPMSRNQIRTWLARERDEYQRARHLFAFYDDTRRSLIADYGVAPENVTVVGAGINVERFPELSAPISRAAAESSSAPTLLFIGNDFVRKGGMVLLEAFRRLRQAIPGARLRLIGTDPRIPAQPGVEVLGRVRDRQRIEQEYRDATLFVLPSLFDPFPLVVLEAMAFGLPVVTTRQSGSPDIVVDGVTGALITPGQVDELTEALLDLLRDPARRAAYGAAGRDRAETTFRWDRVVDRMAPVLEAAAPSLSP